MNTSHHATLNPGPFGLRAASGTGRVILPLKGVECEFVVCGGIVEVGVSQIFQQENPKPLDCEYVFPLPADASVYFCEAEINGRFIRATVQEREQARRLAVEKKALGYRTALVESERDNLFTLSLGNVQPDDLVVVRLKYFQPVRSLDRTRSLEIPVCPGVRYIPGKPLLRSNSGKGVVDDTDEVPDASRISPVRIDAEHPDAAYMDVSGSLDSQYVQAGSLSSPSHSIETRSSSGGLKVALSHKGEVPDRDFVLRWEEVEAEGVAPRAWLRERNEQVYALLEVRAPVEAPVLRSPLDFYFLVDRSGSMQGQKWSKAIEALQSCLRVLGPDDRAMITFFETDSQDFAEQPLPVKSLLENADFQGLQQLGTGGGTNLAPALQHVLEVANAKSKGKDRNLILITDAQIGNEPAILELLKGTPSMPVHCFGIDIALNDALLLALTRQQGGTFHSLHPNDNIQAHVAKLGQMLRQPVLLDLQLSDGWESADARIPNLYAGQILYLSARATSPRPLELSARTPAGERVSFRFNEVPVTGEAPCLHWCKARIQRKLAEGKDQEAIQLSVTSNLLCRLTAFVAWDEAEKVIVAQHAIVQPSMELADTCCIPAMPLATGAMELRAPPCASFDAPLQRRSFSAPSLLNRFFGKRLHGSVSELHKACRRLGGDQWKGPFNAIAKWVEQAPSDAARRKAKPLKRLVQKITLCATVKEALEKANGREGLAVPFDLLQRDCRRLQQRWSDRASDVNDLESILRILAAIQLSKSSDELNLFARDLEKLAVQMLSAECHSCERAER